MKRCLVVVPMVLAIALLGAPVGAEESASPSTTTLPTTPTTTPPTTTTEAPAETTSTTAPPTTTTTTEAPPPPPAADPPSTTAAATPSIVVTPSTDLVHNQSVTITGTGFSPGIGIGMAECEAGSFSPSDCDLSSVAVVTADPAGAWSTSLIVHRQIRNAYETIDCVAAPGTCVIGAANLSNYEESASAPLAFDPTVPLPPPPLVTVAPSTGLVHDQQVIVTGSGFAPNTYVGISQCLADGVVNCDYSNGTYVQASATGQVATVIRVHRRIFTTASGVFDCGSAPAACEIRAEDEADLLNANHAPISFDPTVPPPPAPVVTVTPSTDLVHRQVVTVNGRGFAPGAPVGIAQCEAGAPTINDCDLGSSAYITADARGRWSTTFNVRRVIRNSYEIVDCSTAPGACVIAAANTYDYAESGSVAISFDPDVPPPPPPVVTVTPSTDLAHNQTVTVTGSGFAPNAYVSIVECLAGTSNAEDCDYGTDPYKQTDASGSFEFKYLARRVIRTYTSGVVDCTEAPQGCEIRYEDYADVLSTGRTPISFDPAIPLPPPPTLVVTPDTDLVNRQTVDVSGSGYGPHDELQITVCATTATAAKIGPFPPDVCDYVGYLTTDGSGNFEGAVKVRRVIFGYEGPNVDCAERECELRAESYSDALGTAAVPIGFDDSLPAPPPYPEIDVTPATALEDGAAVTVTGAGFAPSASVGVGQCTNPPASESDCDPGNGLTVTTDANGAFTTTIVVRRVITTANAKGFDCSAGVGRCVIGAANLADIFGEYDLSPGLAFAPLPPPPPQPPLDPPPSGPTGAQPRVLGVTITRAAPTGDPLARTGAALDVQALAGLVLLVLGLLLSVVARMRGLVLRRS